MATELTQDLRNQIVRAIQDGVVPPEGLEQLAVGLEPYEKAIVADLQHVKKRHGGWKAIRGDFGSGKTFLSKLALARARDQGFATSHVVLVRGQVELSKRESVYRAVCRELRLPKQPKAGFAQLLDRWLLVQTEAVKATSGVDDEDEKFLGLLDARVESALGKVGTPAPMFAAGLASYARAKHTEDFALARGLAAFLQGDPGVGHKLKGGLKGEIDDSQAFFYLRAVLELVESAGLSGLAVVLDEADTLVNVPRKDSRQKSWEVLREFIDALNDDQYPGLYLVFTGTAKLFEGKQGIKEYGALDQRVSVVFKDGEPQDYRQRQVRLEGFDANRLKTVAKRVREIYPAENVNRVLARATDPLLDALVAEVTKAFGGKVAVMPRLFLREWVKVLNLIDQNANYDPSKVYKFSAADHETIMSAEEKVATGRAAAVDDVPPQSF